MADRPTTSGDERDVGAPVLATAVVRRDGVLNGRVLYAPGGGGDGRWLQADEATFLDVESMR